MYRCLALRLRRRALIAGTTALLATLASSLPASAQVQRAFPQNALRGTIEFGAPPEIELNGKATRLSPGARIRGLNNLLVMSGELPGKRAVVNYTYDASGLVRDVWLLRPEETRVRPWPVNVEQLQTWQFDPAAQTWNRP